MVEVDYSGATAFLDLSLFSFLQNHQVVFIWFNYSLLLVGSMSAFTFTLYY